MDDCSRREFFTTVAGGAMAAATGRVVFAQGVPADDPLEALSRIFLAPPDAAKPMTRWWWFGGAVTPGEITRELTFMRDAGIGGAEIQPVYPVTVDDPAAGIRHHRYYSPEWFDLLRHASREARRLGLRIDLTLGSGWPYGGPFVPPERAARRLRVVSADLAGPRRFSWDAARLVGEDGRAAALVLAPVGDDGMARVEGATTLEPSALLEPSPGKGALDIPAGRWRLMLFVDEPTGMQVKRPTLGMEGLVIDHHDREAVNLFLRAAGDRVFDAVGTEGGRPAFDSVFCDSLEVYGADWTTRLPAEFERRRGYRLEPFLPALAGDAGPLTPHVRYDYHLTLSDLIVEGFFAPLAEWSARRGVRSRVQAHGAMGDVMRGYGLADVPEGENIFLGDRYQVNLKHRRLASSAAHIYGKRVASAETYTWLRTPVFTTTLEMMKAATDSVFLDGITQVVNHGYSYSPPEAGEPGWAFYASTEVNHTQTWWRHYPHLARYVQRVSAVLQQGESLNPVLVYLPMADVYAGHGLGGLHLDEEVQARLDPALLDGIRRAGYDFDVVNDHALAEVLRIEGPGATGGAADEPCTLRSTAGTGRYRVVVVNAVRLMPPESAARMAEFVRAGGQLIVVGGMPEEAPGVKDHDPRTAAMREALAGLWGGTLPAGGEMISPVLGAALVPDVPSALARLARVLAPDFRIVAPSSSAHAHVGFVHRRLGGADCYFVANVSPEPRDLRVEFGVGHARPRRWDPESGVVGFEPPYEYVTRRASGDAKGQAVTSVELRLAPFESCFVVFGGDSAPPAVVATDPRGQWEIARKGAAVQVRGLLPAGGDYGLTLGRGRRRRVRAGRVPAAVRIDGPWTLTLGAHPPVTLDRLLPWDEVEAGRGFSGWGVYEARVEVPDVGSDIEWFIDLGRVHETAQVALNGRDLGAAWKGLRRLPCGRAIARGTNHVRVEVANLWIHHLLAHPPGDPARKVKGVGPDAALAETAGIRWGTYGEVPPERVPPSGLLGPVRLVPLRIVTCDFGLDSTRDLATSRLRDFVDYLRTGP